MISEYLNPILSAKAPEKVGKKYKPPEKAPEIQAASISVKPKTLDK